MEQKLAEVNKENSEEAKEYFDFIKTSVADGSYFKDALNWYFFRYVTPICDRTLLIFGAVIAAVVLYFLVQLVQSAFPLVEKDPIIVRSVDQSIYFPNLVELKPKKDKAGYDQNILTVDEAVLKYLLSVYIKDRESFDYSKAEIEDVNKKFNHMKNTSSSEEYRNFQFLMSKDNPETPLNYFGQDVKRMANIDSVSFSRNNPKDFAEKARYFLSDKTPTEAEIRFTLTTKNTVEEVVTETKEKYLVKIKFNFNGINKDEKKGHLNFTVNSYKLFKVK